MAEEKGKITIQNRAKGDGKITTKENTKAGKDAAFAELETTMERLRLDKEKFQYHTGKDLSTKEEAMENFRLGIIDRKYEEKWQISQQRRNRKKIKQIRTINNNKRGRGGNIETDN